MVWDQSAMASGWILGEETVSIFEGNRRWRGEEKWNKRLSQKKVMYSLTHLHL
jgi:hypothetical protein